MWARPLWLDEELTIFQATDKSFGELISSVSLGVNAIPYLYFILVWGLDQVMTVDLFSIRQLSFLSGLDSDRTNAFVSFLVPSIHYVGLFYSGVLFATFLFLEGKCGLMSANSFLAGWSLFLVLHLGQIWLFLNGDTVVVADGHARPGFSDFWFMLVELILFASAMLIGGAVAFLVLSKRSKTLVSGKDDSRFLLWAATGFLLIPIAYFVFAWIGLPKLTLSRYYYPTCLSGVIFTACVLKAIMIDLKSRSSLMRFTVSFVLTFLAIGLGLYGTSKYWQNFDSEPKILSFREDLVEDLFFEEDGAIREVVTPNLHVCFGFYYHYPELRPHLHLLRPKSTQADGWEKSHTEIQVLAPDRLKEFQQFIIACYVTSLNNFPDLDPIVWAESNSFSYTYREMNPLQGVYRFTKDEWVNASTTQNGNVSYRAKKRPGLSFRKIRVIRLAITYSRTASWRHYHWRLRA